MTAAVPFLQRNAVRALIFGSFFVLTLPLCAFIASHPGDKNAPAMAPMHVYFVAFGITHFVLTFAVYLSSENRRYFASSGRNMLVFWVLPLLPFVFLAAWFGLAFNTQYAEATLLLGILIRALDFQHISRQSFGVLQLMKGSARGTLPTWAPRAENAHFLGLAALLLWSFANGSKLDLDSPVTWAALAWTVVFFVATCVAYGIGFKRGGALGIPLLYFLVQTTALTLAVYKLAFYACALAIHYVEYHLVMGRRVLKTPAANEDRVLGALQRKPWLLYAGVLVLSAAWFGIGRLQPDFDTAAIPQRTLVHLFDGLFVFHYVIEMSIWKLSAPYFRKAIAPLFA